jgi:hypothetical protein
MKPRSDPGALTLHRRSSWNVVALGLGLVIVVETVPTHLVAMERAPAVAWALSALSLYALLWLIGDSQALRLRPCRLEDDALRVRVGLRWKVEVPRAAFAAFTPVRGNRPRAPRARLRARHRARRSHPPARAQRAGHGDRAVRCPAPRDADRAQPRRSRAVGCGAESARTPRLLGRGYFPALPVAGCAMSTGAQWRCA